MGCHFLLQGIFPTQGLNPGLPIVDRCFYPLSHQGSQQSSRSCEIIQVSPGCRYIIEALIKLTSKSRSATKRCVFLLLFFKADQWAEKRGHTYLMVTKTHMVKKKKKKWAQTVRRRNVNYIVLQSAFHVQHPLSCVLFMPPALFPTSNSSLWWPR